MFAKNWERVSEGDCRAAAYVAILEILPKRYAVRTELKLPKGLNGSPRGARLDMAILDRATGRIVLILETKRSAESKAEAQGKRYAAMAGAPVLYLRGMDACQDAGRKVADLLPRLESGQGV